MGVSIDWLSLLPDSLLSTIASSLPFKEAVRTSILSKNWEKICKSTTNIEFNELFFVKFDQPHEVVYAQRMAFLDFMKKWMENRGENVIDKFSLRMAAPKIFRQNIDRCIKFAIRNGVKDLELDFTSPTWIKEKFYYDNFVASIDLPNYVYGYSELESLKLYSCDFAASEMVSFHSLKEISLGFMRVSMCAIEALLTNCEMLNIYTRGRPKRTHRNMNVKHLILKATLDKFEFTGIIFLLKSCPNLEHLTIEIVDVKYLMDYVSQLIIIPERNWFTTIEAYECVKSHLKKIEIKGFKGTKDELSVISYFLIRGTTLRKMGIDLLKDDVQGEFGPNVTARGEAAEFLLTLPKDSTNLELTIY